MNKWMLGGGKVKFKRYQSFSVTGVHEVCVRCEWEGNKGGDGKSKVVLI